MFTHKCEMCGMEFESASNRAKYCVCCRNRVQVARNRAYAEKKKSGKAVAIGSEQKCQICGKPYIVTSGAQKYCKDCAKKQQQAQKGKVTADYLKENYDYIRFNVPKGGGDVIKTYAREHGMTIKRLLLSALEEYMKNHR